MAGAMVVAVLALGVAGWQWFKTPAGGAPTSFADLEITRLARIADLDSALLSSDGRLLAYTVAQAGLSSLVVRQISTNHDLVTHTADGTQLLFLRDERTPDIAEVLAYLTTPRVRWHTCQHEGPTAASGPF